MVKTINEVVADDIQGTVQRIKQQISDHFIEFRGVAENAPLRVLVDDGVRFVRLSLQAEVSFHLDTIEILDDKGENVGLGKSAIISSCYENKEAMNGSGALLGRRNGGVGFHTEKEANPWLIVDLGTTHQIKEIVVYNRDGDYFFRAMSLMIETGTDLKHWQTVFDNWRFLKSGNMAALDDRTKALLYSAVLELGPPRAYINQLKKQSQHEEAVVFLDQVNSLLYDRGIAMGPHGFVKTFALFDAADKQHVYQELAQVLAWLNTEFGVSAFVSSGTLLGIVRDGALIGHDDDVDICYIGNTDSEESVIEERARIVEFMRSKGCTMTPSDCAHYKCKTPGGLDLDLFTGFFEDGKCSFNPLGRREIEEHDVLPLQERTVQGCKLHLPANPEAFLVLNYGKNWRTPDPLWTFQWDKAHQDFSFLYF